MEGQNAVGGAGSKLAPEKLVKVETGDNSGSSSGGGDGGVDLGAKIAEAFELGTYSSEVSDEQVYRDPGPLKWRIFEVVAARNGQRAFGTYWSALRAFMHGWLPRGELDEALEASLGVANVHLHNELILCLLHNARCRYLPVELVSQVPPSSRGKVVHATVKPPPRQAPPTPSSASRWVPPPTTTDGSKAAALSGPGAATSPFQGKRTEGLLSNADEKAATANGGGSSEIVAGAGRGVAASAGNSEFSPRTLKIEVGADSGKEPGGATAAAAVKLEARAAGGGGEATASVSPAGSDRDASFSPGGKRRRDDDRIPPATATATATASAVAAATTARGQEGRHPSAPDKHRDALLEEAQLLEEEIRCHFGAGSDLWRPWSGRGGSATGKGRDGYQQLPLQPASRSSSSSRKRSASSDDCKGQGQAGHGDQRQAAERNTKALKSEWAAVAGGPAANGGSGGSLGAAAGQSQVSSQREDSDSQQQASPRLQPSGQRVVSKRAAGRAAAEQALPGQRSQRVPGARTLAPLLQALTASQHMKVSHEVCRVMTASVKEYLRRIIEACLISAREGEAAGARQPGGKAAAGAVPVLVGAKGMPSAGSPSNVGNETPAAAATAVAAPGIKKQPAVAPAAPAVPSPIGGTLPSTSGDGSRTPLALAPPPPGGARGGGGGGVLTPAHLQTALETTPRLVGPPSSTRAQWRRVATYAGEHPGRGCVQFGPAL